ncbi:MAG: hypothetical protein IKA17_02650 [Clostridia bacterium]|nr:hypothetical protein [Clostridia bacterium]
MQKGKNILAIATIFSMIISMVSFPVSTYAQDESAPYFYEDFENGIGSLDTENTLATYEIVDGGYGGAGKALKVTQDAGAKTPYFPIVLEKGKTYEISCRVKLDKAFDECIGDQKVDGVSLTGIDVNKLMTYFIDNVSFEKEGTPYKGYLDRRYIQEYKAGDWTEVKTTYTVPEKAWVTAAGGSIPITDLTQCRIGLRFGRNGDLKELTGGKAFTYLLDDFYVVEANMKSPYPLWDFEDETIGNASKLGAANSKGTNEIVSDGNGGKCAKITMTGDYYSLKFPLTLDASKKYTISADIKVETPLKEYTTADAGKNVVIDGVRKTPDDAFDLNTAMAFRVDGANYTNGTTTSNGWAVQRCFTVPNWRAGASSWQTASWVLDPTVVEYNSGLKGNGYVESYSNPFITLRLGHDNVLSTLTESSSLVYYLDNLKVVEEGFSAPEVKLLTKSGYVAEGQSVTVNCQMGNGETTGYLQLFKKASDGGWASVDKKAITTDYTYTFTKDDVGAEFKARVTPIDLEGKIGAYKEIALGKVLPILSIESEFVTEIDASTVGATVTINDFKGDTKLVALLLLLDSDGACISVGYNNNEDGGFGTYSFDVEANNTSKKAVKAKLLLWEGTTPVDTTMIPIGEANILD